MTLQILSEEIIPVAAAVVSLFMVATIIAAGKKKALITKMLKTIIPTIFGHIGFLPTGTLHATRCFA